MDPFSALGVAAAVIQFVDFSSKAVSAIINTTRLLDSGGSFKQLEELQTTTKRLQSANFRLRTSLDPTQLKRKPTEIEAEVADAADECIQVSTPLLEALRDLHTYDRLDSRRDGKNEFSRLRIIRYGLKAAWEKERLMELETRLRAAREQLMFVILLNLREEITQLAKASSPREVGKYLPTVEEQILQQLKQIQNWQENLSTQFNKFQQDGKRLADVIDDIGPIQMPEWSQTGFAKSIQERMLERLHFPELHDREEQVVGAHESTFHWILSEPQKSSRTWSSFSGWLQSKSDLYWITGKPGSGKSTLMKYIIKSPLTNSLLKNWAGGDRLIVSSFYFWHAGTEMQQSQEGLLRTLLYQALNQMGVLSKTTLLRWNSLALSLDPKGYWTWTDLGQAFQFLLLESDPPTKYCFFIDGLDEFRGDLSSLLKLLHRISSHPKVKVCISSRPWIIFEDEYCTKPHLMLQNLTYPDIIQYINSTLSSYEAFKELRILNEKYTKILIENIAERSSGVFLWVVLVVRSLIEGLRDGDRLSDLQTRLDSLPPELEELFKRMLHNFDRRYFSHASALFQLVKASTNPPSLILLSLADEEDAGLAIRADVMHMQTRQRYYRAITMKRRLDSRCKGLLEVSAPSAIRLHFKDQHTSTLRDTDDPALSKGEPTSRHPREGQPLGLNEGQTGLDTVPDLDTLTAEEVNAFANGKVQYLHRTVKDFLDRPEIWEQFQSATSPHFNAVISLAHAHLLQLKWIRYGVAVHITTPVWDSVFWVMRYAAQAEMMGHAQVALVEELERITIKMFPPKDQYLRKQGQLSNLLTERQAEPAPTTNFLHLVVHCRLPKYLDTRLKKERQFRPDIISLLTTAIFKAAEEYQFQDGAVYCGGIPSTEMVEILLAHSDLDDAAKSIWRQQAASPPAKSGIDPRTTDDYSPFENAIFPNPAAARHVVNQSSNSPSARAVLEPELEPIFEIDEDGMPLAPVANSVQIAEAVQSPQLQSSNEELVINSRDEKSMKVRMIVKIRKVFSHKESRSN